MSSSYPRRKNLRTTVSCESIIVMAGSRYLFCLLLLAVPASAHAKVRWNSATDRTDRNQAFIVSQNERGEIVCREATSEERQRVAGRNGGGPMRVIYSGAPRRKDLPYGSRYWISDEAAGLPLQVSVGLRIVLHGPTQLGQNQNAKKTFTLAANRLEAII